VVYNNRAWALLKAGKAEEAVPDAEKSLELNPNSAPALDTRGSIFEALGRRDEAIADFRRALEVAPNNPIVQEATAGGLERLARRNLRIDRN